MTNAELIKALRWCGDESDEWCVSETYECPLWNEDRITDDCKAELMTAAADALEAADEKIVELQKQVNEFIKNETHSTVIKVMSRRISELEAQIPKEGKWIRIDEYIYDEPWECSNCETTNSCRSRYCPNCGARMKFNDKQKTESENTKSSLEYDYCGTPKYRYDIEARMKGEEK